MRRLNFLVLWDMKVKGLGRQTETLKNLGKNSKKKKKKKHQLDMKLETVTTSEK